MNQTQVSVIIPNYNHAAYLEERIESVLAQTYRNFEIILLDDCSTDDSLTIFNRYRYNDKVSAIIVNEVNGGTPFRQWAKGIELAKHDWVWIAESDDWCEPTLLQTLVDGVTVNTAFAFCQSLMVQDNKIIWSIMADDLNYIYQGNDFNKGFMLKNTRVYNASMCIFRKELYYKINKNFTAYKFCGDWLFWMLLAQQGDVFMSGKVLNYFRKHDKDVSGLATINGVAYVEYLNLLEDLLNNKIINKNEKFYLLKFKLNELLLNNKVINSKKSEIKLYYYRALGEELLNWESFMVFGKKMFIKICFDSLLGR